jgi:hypothetical protein
VVNGSDGDNPTANTKLDLVEPIRTAGDPDVASGHTKLKCLKHAPEIGASREIVVGQCRNAAIAVASSSLGCGASVGPNEIALISTITLTAAIERNRQGTTRRNVPISCWRKKLGARLKVKMPGRDRSSEAPAPWGKARSFLAPPPKGVPLPGEFHQRNPFT